MKERKRGQVIFISKAGRPITKVVISAPVAEGEEPCEFTAMCPGRHKNPNCHKVMKLELRQTLDDGVVRNQPRCPSCRSLKFSEAPQSPPLP